MVNSIIRISLLLILALSVSSCCSKARYAEALEEVENRKQENSATDLLGWDYREVESAALDMEHRYYHFPSGKQNAPVIFFVHGMSLDGRCFIQLRQLAEDFELIAYNLPESSPYYSAGFDDYVPLLNDFFKVMNIDSISMAGVSYGGAVTMSYFSSSEREVNIDKVMLISTDVFGATKKARRRSRQAASLMRGLNDRQVFCIVSKGMERSDDLKDSSKTPPITGIVGMKSVDWYRQVLYSTGDYNGIADAEAIDCPVIIFHGDRDGTIDYDDSRENFANHIPEAEFVTVADGKHSMIYESSDELAPLFEAFLSQ